MSTKTKELQPPDRSLALLDDLWRARCATLWSGKISVAHRDVRPWARAFAASAHASRSRAIDAASLSALTFWFRFTASAGDFWMAMDPSWDDGVPCTRRFEADGRLSAPADDVMLTNLASFEPPSGFRWRFRDSKRYGRRIQVNQWPSYTVHRTKSDWGYAIVGEWTVFRTVSSHAEALAWCNRPI